MEKFTQTLHIKPEELEVFGNNVLVEVVIPKVSNSGLHLVHNRETTDRMYFVVIKKGDDVKLDINTNSKVIVNAQMIYNVTDIRFTYIEGETTIKRECFLISEDYLSAAYKQTSKNYASIEEKKLVKHFDYVAEEFKYIYKGNGQNVKVYITNNPKNSKIQYTYVDKLKNVKIANDLDTLEEVVKALETRGLNLEL